MPVDFTLFSWTTWSGHPSVLIGLLLLEILYLVVVWPRIRQCLGRVATFTAGVVSLFLALHSPLHELSDHYLFSAHMVQHLILQLIAVPLMLLGTPPWAVRPIVQHNITRNILHAVTSPVTAFLIFNGILILWHMPLLYNAALHNHNLHILQHLMFIGSAVLIWWPIFISLDESTRLAYPWQILYLFLLSLLPAIVGAFITFSGSVLYTFYADAPRLWGISPLYDQQLGGLIMKVAGSLVFWLVLIIVFFKWFNREEAQSQHAQANKQLGGHS